MLMVDRVNVFYMIFAHVLFESERMLMIGYYYMFVIPFPLREMRNASVLSNKNWHLLSIFSIHLWM